MFKEVWDSWNKRQKIVLTIYFILSIPLFPCWIILPLMKRFIFEDKRTFQPEYRADMIAETLSMSISMWFVILMFVVLPIYVGGHR